jgi:hypothetical protein
MRSAAGVKSGMLERRSSLIVGVWPLTICGDSPESHRSLDHQNIGRARICLHGGLTESAQGSFLSSLPTIRPNVCPGIPAAGAAVAWAQIRAPVRLHRVRLSNMLAGILREICGFSMRQRSFLGRRIASTLLQFPNIGA